MNKKLVIEAILEKLERQKSDTVRSLQTTREAIVDAPGPMQSHSDTTRYQKSILAESAAGIVADQAKAIFSIREILKTEPTPTDRVQLGSLVTVTDDNGSTFHYIILAAGGGTIVTVDGAPVIAITPGTPIALEIIGKSRGQEAEIATDAGFRHLVIGDIA